MKTFFTLSLALSSVVSVIAGGIHSHQLGQKCACLAQVLDFEIRCTNTQAITDALARLQTGGCASNCHTPACEKDWLILQTHHDHCPIQTLPTSVEFGFHDYDRICNSCDIVREEIPNAPTCPSVNCEDGSGNAAYQRLLTRNCNLAFGCTQANCRDDYLTLRMVHDTCDHGALSQTAEEGLHALEEPCAAFTCNLDSDVISSSLECYEDELEEIQEAYGLKEESSDDEPSPTMAPNYKKPSGGFDFGSAGVTSKLATGSIAIMAMIVVSLF